MYQRTLSSVVAVVTALATLATVGTVAASVSSAGALPGRYEVVADGTARTFIVPAAVRAIRITAIGGGGGTGGGSPTSSDSGGRGGNGGQVVVTVPVTPGDALKLAPGTSGDSSLRMTIFGGGDAGHGDSPGGADGGRGGAASEVFLNNALVVVAGGGGGGGGAGINPSSDASGGAGGGGNGFQGTRGEGPGNGSGGRGLVTNGRFGGAGGNADYGSLAGGGGGGGGGWIDSLGAGGGVGGSGATFGPGGGGGGAGGGSWSSYGSAVIGDSGVAGQGKIVLEWAPRPNVHVLSTSPNIAGQTITFTVDVTPDIAGAPVATGMVSLSEVLATAQPGSMLRSSLVNGRATFQILLPNVGENKFVANYEGDSYYEAATSDTFTEYLYAPHVEFFAPYSPSIDFGQVMAGTTAQTTVKIQNVGNLGVSHIEVATDPRWLSLDASDCSGRVVAVGGWCNIVATLAALSPQTVSSSVVVSDGVVPGPPLSIPVKATVVAVPSATPSATQIGFGNVTVGSSAQRTLTITDNGTVPWTPEVVALGLGGFSFVTNGCTTTLAAGASCNVVLAYTPTAVGLSNGSLQVADTTGSSRFVVTLVGAGVAPTPPPPAAAAPVITDVSPSSGPLRGGTRVTIKGRNLGLATGVTFDTTPATRFSCSSATRCTAVSPTGSVRTTIDIRVTTPGGTSAITNHDHFQYTR